MSTFLYPKNQHRQEISQFPLIKKSLIPWVKLLPTQSKLSVKLTRLTYGKKFKHMRNVGINLQLTPSNAGWEISWNGKLLTTTLPFPQEDSAGKPLWIMATGPSICDLELEQLQGHTVIGLNGAIATCKEYSIEPTYYAITDRDFFENRMPLVAAAIQSGAHCFFSFNGLARICEYAPELLESAKISLLETVNRYYMIPQLNEFALREELSKQPKLILPDGHNLKSGWSHDASIGVFTGNTIAYIACQIAESLKFQNAYILGMDLGSSANNTRSYETGNQARPTTIDKDYEDFILPAFELLSQLKLNTKFWNISSISKLPNSIVPRKSFQTALAETNKIT